MVATTESLRVSVLRCGACGSRVRGAVIGDRGIGLCCATNAADRAELERLERTSPELEPELPVLVAADPLSGRKGATREAVQIIAALRAKGVRQATPEAVAALGELPKLSPERVADIAYGDKAEPLDFEKLGTGGPIRAGTKR